MKQILKKMEGVNMTDVVVELLTAIVGLGTAMLGIFNEYKNRKKKRNKEEEYYRLVLYPFIIKYRENKEMDAREFLEKNSAIKKNQDVIPTYIYYLLNENDENNENHKKLTKVLWCIPAAVCIEYGDFKYCS